MIAQADPGVPNWLDSSGYGRGMLVGRWYRAETFPVPTIKKVPLRDVRKHLPVDTPKVSTGQRDAALRARNIGLQLRRRW